MKKNKKESDAPDLRSDEKGASTAEKAVPNIENDKEEGSVNDSKVPNTERSADDLMMKLNELQSEAEENKNLYLRAVADLENYRRRAVREKEETRRLATESLVEDLLPALDNLVLGLEAAEQHPEAKPVTEGFLMVMSQITSILQQHGMKEINPLNETFQPDHHECVAHEPCEKLEEGKIISVTRKGYLLHDRLVRPASVIVSSGAKDKKTKKDT